LSEALPYRENYNTFSENEIFLLCFVVVTIRCNNEVRSAKMQFTPGEDPLGGTNPEYL